MKSLLSFEVSLTQHHIAEDNIVHPGTYILTLHRKLLRPLSGQMFMCPLMEVAGSSEVPDFMASCNSQHNVKHQSNCV
jgi:hypothetical protein